MHRHLGRRPCGGRPPRRSAWPLHRALQRNRPASRRAAHTAKEQCVRAPGPGVRGGRLGAAVEEEKKECREGLCNRLLTHGCAGSVEVAAADVVVT
jgi:hypothetical protein